MGFEDVRTQVIQLMKQAGVQQLMAETPAMPLQLENEDAPEIEQALNAYMESKRKILEGAASNQLNEQSINRSVHELLFFASGFAIGSGEYKINLKSIDLTLALFEDKGWIFPLPWCGQANMTGGREK